jgi:hypothetical protein
MVWDRVLGKEWDRELGKEWDRELGKVLVLV